MAEHKGIREREVAAMDGRHINKMLASKSNRHGIRIKTVEISFIKKKQYLLHGRTRLPVELVSNTI